MAVDVVTLREAPNAARRLICLAGAGAGPLEFRAWPEHFDGATELISVRLPGRDSRALEPPFRRLEPMLDEIERALEGLARLPTALFGHSMGALIAFELCRRLEAKNRGACQLFVASRLAPQLGELASRVYALPDQAFMQRLIEYQGAPPAAFAHPSLVRLFLPAVRADFETVETYRYVARAPLSCPIVAFGGEQDAFTPLPALDAWREQTSGTFRLCTFAGGHFFLRTFAAALIAEIKAELERTSAREAGSSAPDPSARLGELA